MQLFSNKESLIRGNSFTITITGAEPYSNYYVWVKSKGLTGASGDQPPIISNQNGIIKDSISGPYSIGNFLTEGGQSIIQNVAQSSDVTSNTNYYAMVPIQGDGTAKILFDTSLNTKAQRYSIRAENRTASGSYISDESEVKIEKGIVTLKVDGEGGYYIGEQIRLYGTNTETNIVYLFDENNRRLSSFTLSVINNDPSSFISVPIQNDNSWQYLWDTSNLVLPQNPLGTTIVAISQPLDWNNKGGLSYGTVTIWLKQHDSSFSVSPSTIKKGESVTIRANVNTNYNLKIWIIGPNFVEVLPQLSTFEYVLTPEKTKMFSSGQYYVFLQEPTLSNNFAISYNPNTGIVNAPHQPDPNTGVWGVTFKISTSGGLQGIEAVNALTEAFEDPKVSDIYTKSSFTIVDSATTNPITQPITTTTVTTAQTTVLATAIPTTVASTIQTTEPITITTTQPLTSIYTPTPSRTPTLAFKKLTPWPTDTPTQPSPIGVEIGIAAMMIFAVLVVKRK